MNVSVWIARRYFSSGKEKKFINVLSIIAMLGVAVGTAALVIVLSAFNGLEALVRKLDQRFDPELKISAAEGKFFVLDTLLAQKIRQAEGVQLITDVIEDNCLLRYKDAQIVARVKGVAHNFHEHKRIDEALIAGNARLMQGNVPVALIGAGIQQTLSVGIENRFDAMQLWYPKAKKSVTLNPADAFTKKSIFAGGVFQISSQYDDKYIFVPIAFAQELLQYGNKRTSIEVKVKPDHEITDVKQTLQVLLGDKFLVQDTDEQHASFMRVMKIEKLFTFCALLFILLIASFNIFVSLSMLVIEKKRDISVFYTMGASPQTVKKIFMAEGTIIAGIGTAIGLSLGFAVCFAQMQFGFVSMGMTSAVVEAYPVQIRWQDFAITGLCVVVFTILATYGPAMRASKNNFMQ
jgi:lipoprotein-releasing system permease protein